MDDEYMRGRSEAELAERVGEIERRLRMQERIMTELFEAVRRLNVSVQAMEQSTQKRIAVDEALLKRAGEISDEQRDQRAEHRAEKGLWQTNRGYWLALIVAGFLLVNVILNTVSVMGK